MKRKPGPPDQPPGTPAAANATPHRRRSRGRPAGLSREAIIASAMQLLLSCTSDELSFAMLAEHAGVATMTLYNYFPNREALLNAVADHAFSLLELPPARARQSWQKQLMAWLWAMQKHCKHHPVILKVMGFEGGVSNAWMAATTPAYRILRDRGLDGRRLAQVSSWFLASAMGLIIADTLMPAYRRPAGLAPLEAMDADTQEIHWLLRKHTADIGSDEWLEFGFQRLIASLEQVVEAGAKP
jgi:AcrR family transcriptional regulator